MHYDRQIFGAIQRGETAPEQLEATAATSGQSVNAWIIDAIKDKL